MSGMYERNISQEEIYQYYTSPKGVCNIDKSFLAIYSLQITMNVVILLLSFLLLLLYIIYVQ